MKKKPYTPPTITNFGNVVVQTKGMGGECWEIGMYRPLDDPDPIIKWPPKD